ncbi:MAG: hypothetical protein LBF84_02735 [Holosporales bacterium]|jgi:hypothetical protein|nr:hypothetical protein [Holosporales bacterium]
MNKNVFLLGCALLSGINTVMAGELTPANKVELDIPGYVVSNSITADLGGSVCNKLGEMAANLLLGEDSKSEDSKSSVLDFFRGGIGLATPLALYLLGEPLVPSCLNGPLTSATGGAYAKLFLKQPDGLTRTFMVLTLGSALLGFAPRLFIAAAQQAVQYAIVPYIAQYFVTPLTFNAIARNEYIRSVALYVAQITTSVYPQRVTELINAINLQEEELKRQLNEAIANGTISKEKADARRQKLQADYENARQGALFDFGISASVVWFSSLQVAAWLVRWVIAAVLEEVPEVPASDVA